MTQQLLTPSQQYAFAVFQTLVAYNPKALINSIKGLYYAAGDHMNLQIHESPCIRVLGTNTPGVYEISVARPGSNILGDTHVKVLEPPMDPLRVGIREDGVNQYTCLVISDDFKAPAATPEVIGRGYLTAEPLKTVPTDPAAADYMRVMSAARATDRFQEAIRLANLEAQRLNSEVITTTHLLLGVLEERIGAAAKTLALTGISAQHVRSMVPTILAKCRAKMATYADATIPLRAVLTEAYAKAEQLGSSYVGTEHLLMGLMADPLKVLDIVLGSVNKKMQHLYDELSVQIGQKVPMPTPPAPVVESAADEITEYAEPGTMESEPAKPAVAEMAVPTSHTALKRWVSELLKLNMSYASGQLQLPGGAGAICRPEDTRTMQRTIDRLIGEHIDKLYSPTSVGVDEKIDIGETAARLLTKICETDNAAAQRLFMHSVPINDALAEIDILKYGYNADNAPYTTVLQLFKYLINQLAVANGESRYRLNVHFDSGRLVKFTASHGDVKALKFAPDVTKRYADEQAGLISPEDKKSVDSGQ